MQRNLQIQHNPKQKSMVCSAEIKKKIDPKIHMVSQGTPNIFLKS